MRDVGLASLTLAVCALAGSASAEPKQVLVASAGGDAGIEEVVRDRGLALAGDAELQRWLTASRTRAGEARVKALVAVTGGLARAQDLYLEQKFDAMIDLLSELARSELALLGDPDHREIGWALAFRLGLAHLSRGGRGDRARAARMFGLALAISPERRPAADLYGPDVAAAFSEAVAARERVAPRPVTIRTRPAGALVAVDGRGGIGARRNLRPGLHIVRVSAPGHLTRAELVDAGASKAITIELETDDGDGWIDGWTIASTAPSRPAFDGFWRQQMRAAGADAVLWVGSGRAAVVTGDRVLEASGASPRAAAKAALDAWLGAPELAGGDRGSVIREPLFWGGVAAAVALGVVGVLVLTSGDDGGGVPGGGGGIEVGVVDP